METAHLQELIELESHYWWHVAKRHRITHLLQQHVPPGGSIVEGGIGAGGNLLTWQKAGYRVHGLDVMPESIEHACRLGLDSVAQHDLHDPWPFEPASIDAVVMLDVLEHLREPVEVLKNASKVLTDNGKIFFTVPAHPWLFSDWDRRLGHFRRYTRSSVENEVATAGLRLERLAPWNMISLPVAAWLRTYRRFIPSRTGAEFPRVSRWMNRLLLKVQFIEYELSKRISIPFGLSFQGVIAK